MRKLTLGCIITFFVAGCMNVGKNEEGSGNSTPLTRELAGKVGVATSFTMYVVVFFAKGTTYVANDSKNISKTVVDKDLTNAAARARAETLLDSDPGLYDAVVMK